MVEYKAKSGSVIRDDGSHETVEQGMQHTAVWMGSRPSDLVDITVMPNGVAFTIESGISERNFIFHQDKGAFEKVGDHTRTLSPIALRDIAKDSPSVKSYMEIALPHKAYNVSLTSKIMSMLSRTEKTKSSGLEL
ncbi:hypothetical protein LMH73_025300 [Vibrio splendidus]|nr:hypothetical protein [Vibrio splendidus]MCC4882555.1 hypothetical protein [Vibrio splendidus]